MSMADKEPSSSLIKKTSSFGKTFFIKAVTIPSSTRRFTNSKQLWLPPYPQTCNST